MKRAFSRRNLWNMVPAPVKALLAPVIECLPSQFYLGRRFRENLRFVRQAAGWSRDQAIAYQHERLRHILDLAYSKTAYYRKVFDRVGFHPADFKSADDLVNLPFIDKATLREHLDDMCAVPPHSPGVDYLSTGGTGGAPLYFYTTSRRSAIEYAYLVASWERVGYRLDMPMAVFRGRNPPPDSSGLRHEYDPLLRHHYYNTFHMTDENMGRYLEHVSGLGPCFLHLYPSAGMTLVQFMRRKGLRPPENVRGILAESENIYPDQRASMEEFFKARFFSSYGHSEKLVLAAECESSTDYHVWPTYGYFELIDEQGRRVTTPGGRGEIVGSGWINDVVPFIRYRTGDYAVYAGEHCPACGRQHTIIRSVEGRWPAGDLVAADGTLVSMTALNVHDDTFARVLKFQFYQDTPGRAILRIVPGTGYQESDEQRIRRTIGERLKGRLEFQVRLVEDIAPSPRGKAIYVDQHIAPADIHPSGTP